MFYVIASGRGAQRKS